MQNKFKNKYDYLKEADKYEEDAIIPEEWISERERSKKEKYFEYYDDIKTSIKEDW